MKTYSVSEFNSSNFPFWIEKQIHKADKQNSYHLHDCIELVYIVKGGGVQLINNISYPIIKGDIYIINEGNTHAFTVNSELIIYNLMFHFSLFPKKTATEINSLQDFKLLFQNTDSDKPIFKLPLHPPHNEIIENMLDTMHQELTIKNCGYKLMIKSSLIILLTSLLRFHSNTKLQPSLTTDAGSDTISRVISYIHSNYKSKLNNEILAEAGMVSKNYISELFKNKIGMSIKEFITKIRIDKARTLLEKDISVTEAGYETGFDDSSYFARSFKKVTGFSPSEYKRNFPIK